MVVDSCYPCGFIVILMTSREQVQPTSSSQLMGFSPPSYASRSNSRNYFVLTTGKRLDVLTGEEVLEDVVLDYTASSSSNEECVCCGLFWCDDNRLDQAQDSEGSTPTSKSRSFYVWGLFLVILMVAGGA
jgi:hypothetical protein